MRFNSEVYDKLFPREEKKEEIISNDDKMVEEDVEDVEEPKEEPKEVKKTETEPEDNNGGKEE